MSRATRRYDAVLFDWDDTLCYAEPHRFLHAREVARHFGLDIPLPEIYQAFIRAGDSGFDDWARFCARLPVEFGVDPDQQASFVHAYRIREVYRRFQLFEDVLEGIDGLVARDLRVGLISNNTEVAVHAAALNVTHHFEVVVSPLTYRVAKPHPEIFARALAQMEVEPERAIYVGDSYDNDVVGARAVGMLPVLVDRFAVHDDAVDAEHRVTGFTELLALLDRLLAPE